MSFNSLIVLLLQTSALLLVALIAMRLARRTPAIRLAMGRLALVATLGLVVFSPWTRLRKQPIVAVDWNPVGSVSNLREALPANKPSAGAARHYPNPNNQIPPADMDEAGLVRSWWLVGACLLSFQMAFGGLVVLRVRRSSRPISHAATVALLASVANDAGAGAPLLRESDRVSGPVVSGVLRPTIYLPTGFLGTVSPDELTAVLRHEVAHVANGDLHWQLLHRVLSILAWPQPLVRILSGPMSAASEELCDRRVLAAGIPAASYADLLLRLRQIASARRASAFGIGVVSRKRRISSRIEAILSERVTRTTTGRSMAVLLSVCALLTALGLTGVFAIPLQAKPEVVGPTKVHTLVRLIGPGNQRVTRAEAWLQIADGTPPFKFSTLRVTAEGVELNIDRVPAFTRGSLIVRAPGLGIAIARIWPQPTPVKSMRLAKASQLEGRLRLNHGTPADQILVRVTRLEIGEPMTDEWDAILLDPNCPIDLTATSDNTGAFLIGGLAPGSMLGFDVDDERYAQLRFLDEFKVPSDRSISAQVITLHRAAQFAGRVVREGKPVAGVAVGAQSVDRDDAGHPNGAGGWGEALTDGDGRYVIKRLPATKYNIALRLDGEQQLEFTAVAHDTVPLHEGEMVAGMDFDLISGAVIEGRVLDAVGRPVPNTPVGVYGPAHPQSGAWVQSATTDAKGRYVLRVPAGEQFVYSMMEGGGDKGKTIRVKNGTRTTLDLKR